MSIVRYARQQTTLSVSLDTEKTANFVAYRLTDTNAVRSLVAGFCLPESPFMSPYFNIGHFDGCLSANGMRNNIYRDTACLGMFGWLYRESNNL